MHLGLWLESLVSRPHTHFGHGVSGSLLLVWSSALLPGPFPKPCLFPRGLSNENLVPSCTRAAHQALCLDPQLSQVSLSRLYLIKGRSRGPQRGALPVTKCTEPHEISQKNQETQLIMTTG